MHLRFRRQHFGGEIERNARFAFSPGKARDARSAISRIPETGGEDPDRLRFKGKQLAIGERFYRRRARRAIQDRQFAKEIAFAIEGEIAFPSVDAGKRARPSFLNHVKRTGAVALPDDQLAFGECNGR